MRRFVLENGANVLAGPVEDEISTAGMGVEKVGHIVDVLANSDIARLCRVVRLDLVDGECGENATRHGCCDVWWSQDVMLSASVERRLSRSCWDVFGMGFSRFSLITFWAVKEQKQSKSRDTGYLATGISSSL